MPICLRLFVHCARRAASPRRLNGRQQQRDQNADDRNHDEQFDERKRSSFHPNHPTLKRAS